MKFVRGVVHSALIGTPVEYRTVRKLLTFDDNDSYLSAKGILYTGLVDFVVDQLGSQFNVEIENLFQYDHPGIKDIYIPDDYIPLDDPSHRLRPYQIITAKKAISWGRGVIEIATGGGKTEIAAIISKYLIENGYAKKVYFIAETRFLAKQAAARFERRGLEGVGRFGGGSDFTPAKIQVCVIDSLRRALADEDEDVCADFADCDVIFFDEAHHAQAKSWTELGEVCAAKYRYGLTATLWADPFKYSYSDFKLIGLTGRVVAHIPSSVLRKQGFLAEPYVTMVNVSWPPVHQRYWRDYYQTGIVQHPRRNSYAVSVARSLYEGQYKTLVFVKQINHGLRLVRILRELGCDHVYFVKGGEAIYQWKPSGRWDISRTSIEELAEIVNSNSSAIVVGTQVLDEGVDVPEFNALIMGTAMKKYRRTIQRVGRGMRPKPGDNSVYIFDFIDGMQDKLYEHSIYRTHTYQYEEYEFSQSLMDTCDRMGIPIILEDGLYEWNEEISRRKPRRRKRQQSLL